MYGVWPKASIAGAISGSFAAFSSAAITGVAAKRQGGGITRKRIIAMGIRLIDFGVNDAQGCERSGGLRIVYGVVRRRKSAVAVQTFAVAPTATSPPVCSQDAKHLQQHLRSVVAQQKTDELPSSTVWCSEGRSPQKDYVGQPNVDYLPREMPRQEKDVDQPQPSVLVETDVGPLGDVGELSSLQLPFAEPLTLSLPLNDLRGSRVDFENLHVDLVTLETDEEMVQHQQNVLRQAHSLLKGLTALELQARIRRYVSSGDQNADVKYGLAGDIDEAIASLDLWLLARGGILVEDVPLHILDRWHDEFEILLCDVGLQDLWSELYGEAARFPIRRFTPSAEDPDAKREELLVTGRRRQFVVERRVQSAAVREYRAMADKMSEDGRASNVGTRARVWMRWVEAMARRITELQTEAQMIVGRPSKEAVLFHELSLEPELVGVITCQTLLNIMYAWRREDKDLSAQHSLSDDFNLKEEERSVPFLTAVLAVGRAVQLEAGYRQVTSDFKDHSDGKSKDKASLAKMRRKAVAYLMRKSQSQGETDWDIATHTVPLGAALLETLMENAEVDVGKDARQSAETGTVKAFEHAIRREGKKTIGHVVLKPSACRQLDFSGDGLMAFLAPQHQPMVIPPRPWQPSGHSAQGGFLMHKAPLVRTTNHRTTNLKSYLPGFTSRVMDILGTTAWQINRRVLECMEEVLRQDLAIAKVPPKDDPPVPPRPTHFESLPESEQKAWKLKRYNAIKRQNELLSDRPTFFLKLNVARDFAQSPRLYFPHSVDFRGRAYPLPPHLNHLSDDVCRGLLTFADARPLGKDGLYWLKVTLANLLGKDKLPFDERVAYVDESKDWIMAVAREPMAPSSMERWANASDGPWQALARCFELADAWKSGDETKFASRLPFQTDGSCNGLQHYAALGRDEWGGTAVNLTPSERPQDVYRVVLEIVIKKVRSEVATDGPDAALATVLETHGLLVRKVVKRTVMTICYGVTTIGAKAQVQGVLADMVGDKIDPKEISLMATYLSRLILRSIDEVFEQAMEIKRWFDQVSRICGILEAPVSWIAPSGLACTQPYKKARILQVKTSMQKVSLAEEDGPQVHKARQRMGFPPNFIHSLDATHMALVADACHREGLVFAGVHDSFWTHACDAPRIGHIIRDAFVQLHGRPLLEELHQDLRIHLGTSASLLPKLPQQGSLDITRVRGSPYFFS
eukprot:TRINITY_DN28472_c0_g1_i1.p1 TRINITY_DN28472_c0_g1~~TRINITY_DN28472_c0_g1_i1.p1  ORF type:complete len:1198 (-),score=164.40 TRINITY_DN28472_c0_g1_i1:144-3737(-)